MAEEQTAAPTGAEPGPSRHSVLHLRSACTIREAAELRQQLLEHLGLTAPLFIDGSAVEKIDTAGVQLLVAFSLDCMERGIPFGWPGRSQPLERAIDALGVAPLLECPGKVELPPTPTTGASH